ncbi:MAG: amino acid transporter [Gammaproteobacteria bacterium]|nr:MAG: amino acid transporter [Gammaproteobacteria bacterium]
MSLFILAKGFSLGLSMIVPIGSQNSMLLTQGINRNYHLLTACLFIVYDILLIALGILGGSLILASSSVLFTLLTWGGIIFLFSYGLMSFNRALLPLTQDGIALPQNKSLKIIIATSLVVTFLNPHAYIDTIMVIGSVGGQYQGDTKIYFMLGTMLASVVWFLTLALAAAKLSPQLSKPKVKRVIDFIIGAIMWIIACSLFITWLNS